MDRKLPFIPRRFNTILGVSTFSFQTQQTTPNQKNQKMALLLSYDKARILINS
jgi:hypothetical protein